MIGQLTIFPCLIDYRKTIVNQHIEVERNEKTNVRKATRRQHN